MNELFEIKLPKFLLADEPKKEFNGFEFIYSPHYLSLILVIHENEIPTELSKEARKKSQKKFTYNDEVFLFIIVQNNVATTGGPMAPEITDDFFLWEAFEWYKSYLIWEDKNIDENNNSKLN